MTHQAVNSVARRRSTRIAAVTSNQSTMQPSLLYLLSRLPPDFTHDDVHACEETVLSTGEPVYLDIVLPYHQDAEARRLGTTKGELDRTSALLQLHFGKEAGEKSYVRWIKGLKAKARAEGGY